MTKKTLAAITVLVTTAAVWLFVATAKIQPSAAGAWTTHNAFTQQDVTYFLEGLSHDQTLTAHIVPHPRVIGVTADAPFTIWYQEKR